MSVLNTDMFFSILVDFQALCPVKTHEEKSHQGKTTMTMVAEVLIAAWEYQNGGSVKHWSWGRVLFQLLANDVPH